MPEDRPAPARLTPPARGEQPANHSPAPLPTPSTPRTPLEPMPRKVIATVAVLIATATIGLVVVLWWAGTAGLSGAELVNARFNALRTGLSIGVGGGGLFALYLAWRRQHATEIGLVQKERDQADVARAYDLQRETAEHARRHAERVAATTERDAEARRITDLYAKSVEQLGSEKAPVRHGGLYALERLAQDHPDNPALRQTVVNVLCAYLRAPFDIPGDPPDASADRDTRNEYREQVQEREVRLTAQRILTAHLKPGNDADHPRSTFWPNTNLDLTGATLIGWHMEDSQVGATRFTDAHFIGYTTFERTKFTMGAMFGGTTFAATTTFQEAKFLGVSFFHEATFNAPAWFQKATFTGDAVFIEARFAKEARFEEALFNRNAWFGAATFKSAKFDGAMVAKNPDSKAFWPSGWQLSADDTTIEGHDGTLRHLVPVETEIHVLDGPARESADD
ncbi:pentapeptide repeat-containing protein [Saccharothrix sp. NPDC042600]|uniref:pentapeptide repeat-containing protein n=1 Tax=Saccharothrix TaxID=2071 RepID=UPI0033E68746|nr:pentapeptide repeat-containing protein [Saccharothrix mutabilis subsp. capreolus]